MKKRKFSIEKQSRPYEQQDVYQDIPSTVDPAGQIKSEATGLGRIKSGSVPWWVLMASWLFLALPSLFILVFFTSEFLNIFQDSKVHSGAGEKLFGFIISVSVFLFVCLIPASLIYLVAKGTIAKAKKD